MSKIHEFLVNKVDSSLLKAQPFLANKSDGGRSKFLEELWVYIYDFRKEGEDPSAGIRVKGEIRK